MDLIKKLDHLIESEHLYDDLRHVLSNKKTTNGSTSENLFLSPSNPLIQGKRYLKLKIHSAKLSNEILQYLPIEGGGKKKKN